MDVGRALRASTPLLPVCQRISEQRPALELYRSLRRLKSTSDTRGAQGGHLSVFSFRGLTHSWRSCASSPQARFTRTYFRLKRTMPRSFLVKKYFAKQKPNYSELECQNDTSVERFPLAELSSADATFSATCFTTGLVWDLSVLPALYLPSSQSEPSGAPGPLDLSSPCSLSSSASSSGEEDEGPTSDPPSPEPVHTYAPRQRMKCTGVMAHISIPEAEEREAPVTAARPAFLCKHCPKEYTSLGALKMHIRSHTLPCVCTTCGKAFSRPWLLRGHIRTHTGERPFSCPHCNRAFADRSNLRAHLQTHAEVKKYQCSVCSRTFSRMSLLQKHSSSGCCSTSA